MHGSANSRARARARTALAAGATNVALAWLLAFSAVAGASAFSDTFADYKAHHRIDPCRHSLADLKKARGEVPPDIDQYAPDFPNALDTAIQQRAAGACGGTGSGSAGAGGAAGTAGGAGPSSSLPGYSAPTSPAQTPAPPAPPDVRPGSAFPGTLAASRASARTSTPAPLLVLAILAVAILVPWAAWYVARLRGWEPRWLPGVRHSVGEAGFRSNSLWDEFADWIRVGH